MKKFFLFALLWAIFRKPALLIVFGILGFMAWVYFITAIPRAITGASKSEEVSEMEDIRYTQPSVGQSPAGDAAGSLAQLAVGQDLEIDLRPGESMKVRLHYPQPDPTEPVMIVPDLGSWVKFPSYIAVDATFVDINIVNESAERYRATLQLIKSTENE